MRIKPTFRDKWGWPLELYTGKPITNLFRILIYTNLKKTLTYRESKIDQYDNTQNCPTTAPQVSPGHGSSPQE